MRIGRYLKIQVKSITTLKVIFFIKIEEKIG